MREELDKDSATSDLVNQPSSTRSKTHGVVGPTLGLQRDFDVLIFFETSFFLTTEVEKM